MPRGPKKHLKRINTPKHWYLNKLSGIYAPRPVAGPHKLRECLPLAVLLREQLKYALTYKECKDILTQRTVKVDNKIRTERKFPLGLMDVISFDRTNENFRMVLDSKGRLRPLRLQGPDEAKYKLLRVVKLRAGKQGIPIASTHDGRNLPYVSSEVRAMDSLVYEFKTQQVRSVLKFKVGCAVMCASGGNRGRVGTLVAIKKHPGATDVVEIEDANGNMFNTRLEYVFVIGEDKDSCVITLPKGDGIRNSIIEDRTNLIRNQAAVRERRDAFDRIH